MISLLPVKGMPEAEPGSPLGEWIVEALARDGQAAEPGDIFVVAQKIVSKAEGRVRSPTDQSQTSRRVRFP